MQTQHSHWLIDWPEKNPPTLDDLAQSNLASIRLRTVVAQRSILRQGWQISQGEKINAKPTVVFIGKIGGRNIEQRTIYWLQQLEAAKASGCRIIMDYTDHHLGYDSPQGMFYQKTLQYVDQIVCSSIKIEELLQAHWKGPTTVIQEPVEVDIIPPRFKPEPKTITALWFGHSTNIVYLTNFISRQFRPVKPTRIIVLTNNEGAKCLKQTNLILPRNVRIEIGMWSIKNMCMAAAQSDICLIPSDKNDIRKLGASPNRLLTALALGLPTAAEMLPSYAEFSKYFFDIRAEGLNDKLDNLTQMNRKIQEAQDEILVNYTEVAKSSKWSYLVSNSNLFREKDNEQNCE